MLHTSLRVGAICELVLVRAAQLRHAALLLASPKSTELWHHLLCSTRSCREQARAEHILTDLLQDSHPAAVCGECMNA